MAIECDDAFAFLQAQDVGGVVKFAFRKFDLVVSALAGIDVKTMHWNNVCGESL